MSDDSMQDKTEDATPKKRQQARQQGQVAKSQEVNSAAVVLGGTVAVVLSMGAMGQGLQEVARTCFGGLGQLSLESTSSSVFLLSWLGNRGATVLAPVLGITFLVGFGAAFAQVGWSFSTEAMSFKADKLNPFQGIKRLANKQALFDLVKNMAKVSLLGLVAWLFMQDLLPEIVHLSAEPAAVAWSEAAAMMRQLVLRLLAVMILLALFDLVWQRYRFEESIRMSKTDVKNEMKDAEGDPQVKARLRALQAETRRNRMMLDVSTADVVVTNPTHFSVAIHYDRGEPAPKVVAKGRGFLALRIREVARDSGVPIVEDPPLARGLYKAAKVGDFVPTKLFEAVARVLAVVYKARRAKQAKA